MSLNNLGNRLLERDDILDRQGIDDALDAELQGLPDATAGWLLARRALWHADAGRAEAAHEALVQGALLADRVDLEQEGPGWVGLVRRDLRGVAEALSDVVTNESGPAVHPAWLWAEWPELAVEEANAWLSARTWDEREAVLRNSTHIGTAHGRQELQVLMTLFPETAPAVHTLEELLDAVRDRGLDDVLTQIGPDARHTDLVSAWVATPTWEESRRVLGKHQDQLLQPRTEQVLRSLDAGNDSATAVVHQHLAVLALCRRLGVDDAYDIVTDLDAGTEAAWDAVARADLDLLETVLSAAPHLLGRAYLAPSLAACLQLMRPHDNLTECIALISQAAEQGTETQRQALTGRLRRLAKRRPDLHDDVEALALLLARADARD